MSGMDRKVIWKGIQCLGACNDAVVIVPLGNITYWSDPNSWTNRNFLLDHKTILTNITQKFSLKGEDFQRQSRSMEK